MCDFEPFDLDQLLADPLVRLMMSSDSVEESEIRSLAEQVTRSRRPHPPELQRFERPAVF